VCTQTRQDEHWMAVAARTDAREWPVQQCAEPEFRDCAYRFKRKPCKMGRGLSGGDRSSAGKQYSPGDVAVRHAYRR
jgi:hypothetical protein